MDRLTLHRHRRFLQRLGMGRVGVACIGDVFGCCSEFHRERRFGDQAWVDEILKAPPGSLEREKLMMETWKMQMEMRRYRQAQDSQVLMATLLDVLVEQQAQQQITRLTEAAMRVKVE